jgi:hypothetical protein
LGRGAILRPIDAPEPDLIVLYDELDLSVRQEPEPLPDLDGDGHRAVVEPVPVPWP